MRNIFIFTIVSLFVFSCKTTDSLSKEERITQIREKVENQSYIFKAQRAVPISGRSIDIGASYYLKVSKDTISVYLPYYGRAYSAPMSNDDAGVKFTSTDFEYLISPEKKGVRDIHIKTSNNGSAYQLYLNISNGGETTLSIQDNRRQRISYYGQIE